jgi:hypothetical protein
MNWSVVDPGPYLAERAWLPIFKLCQLSLLRRMGCIMHPSAGSPPLAGRTLASSLGAELLLALRFCVVVLACALPAIATLAFLGLESRLNQALVLLLALLGALPCLYYVIRRIFSAPIVLWQGLSAAQALEESARLSQGKLRRILWPILLLNGIALVLEGLSGDSMALSMLLLPLGFMLSVAATAWAYRILTL